MASIVAYGTVYEESGSGSSPYTNTANIVDSSETTYGTAASGITFKTAWIHTFDFSSIPSGATIDGITVGIRGRDTYNGNIFTVYMSKSGPVRAGTSHGTWSYASQPSWQYQGGSTDKWGTTWSLAEVQNSDFGIELLRTQTLPNGLRVYRVSIEVFYTVSGTSASSRLPHTVIPEADGSERLAHVIIPEADDYERLAHGLKLAQPASDRLPHTIIGDKPSLGRLAHGLDLVYAVAPNKFEPDTYESGDTVGTWACSSGSSYYDLVDELDEDADFLDKTDYVYITHANIVTGTSKITFSSQSTPNADQSQPNGRRLVIRTTLRDTVTTSYDVGCKAFLIKGGTTYTHSTELETTGGSEVEREWIWETPPWAGDEWGNPEDIKFGLIITLDEMVGGTDQFRITQIYLQFSGTTNGSLLRTFLPTNIYESSGWTSTYLNLWRDVRYEDSYYTSRTASNGAVITFQSDEGGQLRDFLGHATGYQMQVHCRIKVSSDSVQVRGRMRIGAESSHSDYQSVTNTSYSSYQFDIDDPPSGVTEYGDPDDFNFGLYLGTTVGTPTFTIDSIYLVVVGEYEFDRSPHTIAGDKHTGARAGHTLKFGTASGTIDWWNANYLKRRQIQFGTSHSEVPADGTCDFELQTGYGVEIASNAVVNEGLGHSNRGICTAYDSGASPARWYTYCCWHGLTEVGHYNCWVRRYDHYTGTWGTAVDICQSASVSDTHYVPSIAVDGDGYLWIFYGSHDSVCEYRKSTSAYSVTSWGSEQSFAGVAFTYPRPETDSSGNIWLFGRGNVAPPPQGDTVEYAGYFKYTLSTTTWSSWKVIADYSDTADRQYPSQAGSVYSGGFCVDEDDRIHVVLCWWEGYGGTPNKGYAMTHMWSDDGDDWYQFTPSKPVVGELVAATDTAPARLVSHGAYAAADKLLQTSNIANGPWPINNGHALCVDSRGYPHFVTPWVDDGTWANHWGPCELYITSWSGSAWGNTNLTTEVSGPDMMYYRSGCGIYADNTQQRVYAYAFCEPDVVDDYFGGELYRWTGTNWGTSWGGEYLTQNTDVGIGAINMLSNIRSGGNRELLLCRANKIYWHPDINYPYIKPTGKDVRIIRHRYDNVDDDWTTTTEIDRLPDRFRGEDTNLSFNPGVIVPVNSNHAHDFTRHYVYYSYPNVSASAKNDPAEVWNYFEGFEDYVTGSDLAGQGGWTENGTLSSNYICDYYRADLWSGAKWPYIFGGAKSLKISAGNTIAHIQRPLTLNDHIITLWVQKFTGGASDPNLDRLFGIELYDSSSGDWIRLGVAYYVPANPNEHRAAFIKEGDSVPTFSGHKVEYTAAYPEWYKMEVHITSSGVSYWFNDNLVTQNNSYMTSADTLRIGGKSGVGWVDQLTVRRHMTTSPTIVLGTEEGDANVPIPYPRLAHTADMAYWRFARLAHLADLAQSASSRSSHTTVPEAEDDDRIAHWLKAEDNDAARLMHTIVGEYSGSSRLAQLLKLEASDQDRIAHYLAVAYAKSARLSHLTKLEAADIDRLVHAVVNDKHLSDRLAHAIVQDAEAMDRIAHWLKPEAETEDRLPHSLDLDKHQSARLVQSVIPEDSLAARIVHSLKLDNSGQVRLAMALVGDKHLSDRIAHLVAFEAAPEARIAHTLVMIANRSSRLMHTLIREDVDYDRIAHAVIGDKHLSERIAHTLKAEDRAESRLVSTVVGAKNISSRAAHILIGDKHLSARIAHLIDFASGEESRLSHTVKLEAALQERIMHAIVAEATDQSRVAHSAKMIKSGADRLAHILVGEASFQTRLVHSLIFVVEGSDRVAHTIVPQLTNSARLAHTVVGEAASRSQIVHAITLQAQAAVRLAHSLVAHYGRDARLAHLTHLEKGTYSRLVHALSFIGAVIGFHFTAEEMGGITMTEESVSQITFTAESMAGITMTEESMSQITWSSESMAQITLTDETMVP